MDYQFDVINYNKTIPATIMHMDISSDTLKTELQWHNEPEIVFVSDGRAECSRNGDSEIINCGEFVIINSEDVHLIRPVDGGECRLLRICFSLEYIRMFCKSIDSMAFGVEDGETAQEIVSLLKKIDGVETGDYAALIQISYINKLYYLMLTKCLHFRRPVSSPAGSKRDFSYAKTAIAYINENYKREIPLEEIAGVVSLSPSYFSKYFKTVTQVSFSDYLANLRLENAIRDMLERNSTVSAAAFENGFANVKSFITQCKKIYGCTPAQYKKRMSGRQTE